ncbi:ribosomal protein S18 acetylase RimI-like protein [Senna tora]|uniref:Ribosomal protein S18 acetylase RimI-like protein n=1 Tax=Senna tora TaxID=362788 RepID=A0A834X192_9FABA|nr:ribosomal protein S18 acetylase RimI-like protein [Senna tora]
MAYLVSSNLHTPLTLFCTEISINDVRNAGYSNARRKRRRFGHSENRCALQCCSSTSSRSSSISTSFSADQKSQIENGSRKHLEEEEGFLACEYGWRVRRLEEEADEMRNAAQVQAEAFHVPVLLFNDLFFQFFQAEVLAGLLYKLNNSPPNRYACLVAEAASGDPDSPKQIVGVVDATASRDKEVLQLLPSEAQEYLYVSGIAVSTSFRRRKIATTLLKACDMLSILWGFEFLALRAYEDDWGARTLYSNAGYKVVSRDPPWMTWMGRKCRVLMIKRTNFPN